MGKSISEKIELIYNIMKRHIIIVEIFFSISICSAHPQGHVETEYYGKTFEGDTVMLFRCINSSGAFIEAIDYGCHITKICVPDAKGQINDIVLGYDNLEGYEMGGGRFFGALLGRYANRIAGGSFILDGERYQLTCNENPAGHPGHLHGGEKGFDKVMWHGEPFIEEDTIGVCFTRISPDGEEGYPGTLDCQVKYLWSENNTWRIEYYATTNKPTIVCMSQHCYFNLGGFDGGSVLDEFIQINADKYTPNTNWYVPTGIFETVKGTPLDFLTPHRFLERINVPNEQMTIMGGYSANWVLNSYDGKLREAAVLYNDRSGRGLSVWTTEPGLLVYTGISLSNEIIGKNGLPQVKYGGIVLEPIHFPDTPNHSEFPSSVLRPNEKYSSVTEFQFFIKHL